MADEQTKPPFNGERIVPEGYDWPSLLARDGDELEAHYRHVLEELGRKPGCWASSSARRRTNPGPGDAAAADRRPDRQGEVVTLDADVKGDAYEGLLEKNAEDVKTGRRPVLHAAAADRGDRRRHAARAGHADLRPGLRHRRVPARGARLHRAATRCSTPTSGSTCASRRCAAGRSSTRRLGSAP